MSAAAATQSVAAAPASASAGATGAAGAAGAGAQPHAHAHHHHHHHHHHQYHPPHSKTAEAGAPAAPPPKRPAVDAKAVAPFAKVESEFVRVLGGSAVDALYARVTPHPVVTVGGDQLTGKSTLASALKAWLNADAHSAGSIFRAEAVKRGISLPELSRRAKTDPAIDVCIEYGVCELIAAGLSDGRPLIIEGRQPAVMAKYMAEVNGKPNTVRIYLSCAVREQALRFIKREGGHNGPQLARTVDRLLPPGKTYATLNAVAQDILALGIGELTHCMERFVDNQNRDDDDRKRYALLYGLGPGTDYRDPALYDIVIDTTPNAPDDTFAAVKTAYINFLAARAAHAHPKAAPATPAAPAAPAAAAAAAYGAGAAGVAAAVPSKPKL